MTDDFDDDLLRDALRDRSGGPVSTATGRDAVLSRAARSRTRRTLAVGGSTTAVLIAGLILLSGTVDSQLEPAQQPTSSPIPTVDDSPESTSTPPAPSTSTLEEPVPTKAPAADDAAGPSPDASSSSTSSTTPTVPAVAPTPPVSSTTSVPAAPPAPSVDAPFTRTYDSLGGSITVRWDGSVLDLVSVSPLEGFVSEIEDESATRVRVRFRGDDDSRIEVRVDGGKVTSTIS